MSFGERFWRRVEGGSFNQALDISAAASAIVAYKRAQQNGTPTQVDKWGAEVGRLMSSLPSEAARNEAIELASQTKLNADNEEEAQ